eukprot:CAMPEP_0174696174 /NCGR_PEP_ID=MMETSP1094-20130205/2394_1 /TAXON_ID=156173 /ORGANISM="Chrysochromulina brevifilum, Strain UTEX LB 985" /LENGTH=54 /DNA_ID=CAMNT_0015892885 /DNA_START=31 /DNA_END=198 /DNA_ORIENTATION=-
MASTHPPGSGGLTQSSSGCGLTVTSLRGLETTSADDSVGGGGASAFRRSASSCQ